jgi:hypothetical protein
MRCSYVRNKDKKEIIENRHTIRKKIAFSHILCFKNEAAEKKSFEKSSAKSRGKKAETRKKTHSKKSRPEKTKKANRFKRPHSSSKENDCAFEYIVDAKYGTEAQASGKDSHAGIQRRQGLPVHQLLSQRHENRV